MMPGEQSDEPRPEALRSGIFLAASAVGLRVFEIFGRFFGRFLDSLMGFF
jgi:hypothetical protein